MVARLLLPTALLLASAAVTRAAWADLTRGTGAGAGEERLIGWGGETYDSRARSRDPPNIVTLAAMDRERGTWVEPISWYPRAFVLHNFMTAKECDEAG